MHRGQIEARQILFLFEILIIISMIFYFSSILNKDPALSYPALDKELTQLTFKQQASLVSDLTLLPPTSSRAPERGIS